MMEGWVGGWGIGAMEGGHTGEGAGGHKGMRRRARARLASQYPTTRATMMSI